MELGRTLALIGALGMTEGCASPKSIEIERTERPGVSTAQDTAESRPPEIPPERLLNPIEFERQFFSEELMRALQGSENSSVYETVLAIDYLEILGDREVKKAEKEINPEQKQRHFLLAWQYYLSTMKYIQRFLQEEIVVVFDYFAHEKPSSPPPLRTKRILRDLPRLGELGEIVKKLKERGDRLLEKQEKLTQLLSS